MEAEELNSTLVYTGPLPKSGAPDPEKQALFARYEEFVWAEAIHWDRVTLKHRLLGAGGQGAVYLAERRGADGFSRPIALKVFSPEPYPTRAAYEADMAHVASACGRVALLQSDHVVDIHDFVIHNGLRLLEMEYLDGLDIRQMVAPSLLELTRERVSAERLEHVRRVILSEGPRLSRLQPGVAISILRDCLAALSNLHRAGLVHGDIKPANIMLTRQGIAKLIDIGSAVDLRQRTVRHVWSPAYAAPEILQGGVSTPRTDLASLGYVLVEMLSGQQLAPPQTSYPDLLRGKLDLEQRLPDLLPPEVASSEL
ncbi:MAG: serine/threonine-protein kinase, partial [Planctomycetaceae bacterium]